VQESVLRGILPFAGALMPFTYGFTPEGALMPMDDERLLALAGEYGVRPFLHLSTLTAAGTFPSCATAAVGACTNGRNVRVPRRRTPFVRTGRVGRRTKTKVANGKGETL